MTDKDIDEPAPRFVPRDIVHAVRFLTRIPLPPPTADRPNVARTSWAFPLVGAMIGGCGALVLAAAALIGLPAPVAATFCVAATVLITGALHEDGLADTFDSFGGTSRAKRLDIMKDSRIGTFGVSALLLTLTMRIAAVAVLTAGSLMAAVVALVVAESLSRAMMLALWRLTPAAKPDGLSVRDGAPDMGAVLVGAATAGLTILAAALPVLGLRAALLATVFAIFAAYILSLVTGRTLGGRTGDTLGASQQLALAAFLAGASVM